MRLPVRIEGYAGEHDEAGARIVDADGNFICSTGHLKSSTPEGWAEYHETAKWIVDSLNATPKSILDLRFNVLLKDKL